jgi:adenine-specific DNA-methyltransferase
VNLANANELVPEQECDLLYIDPPYNARQYSTNYHVLETLARGDEPEIKGVAGLRVENDKRSAYCKRGVAEEELASLVGSARSKWILMSYNNEGLIPPDRVVEILSERGNVEVYACEYPRYRSDADSVSRKYKTNGNGTVQEMLYWVTTEGKNGSRKKAEVGSQKLERETPAETPAQATMNLEV